MTYIDLSHTIEAGMVTYRGLPAPLICDYLSRQASRQIYAEGTEFQIDRIDMVGNTGTYLDSPFHRYAEGADLWELPLASMAWLSELVGPRAPPAPTLKAAGRTSRVTKLILPVYYVHP